MNECVCDSVPDKKRYLYRQFKWWIRDRLMTLYRIYAYRHVMRLAHRYNWHYAPPQILQDDPPRIHHWCQWCGLRGTTIDITNGPLKP